MTKVGNNVISVERLDKILKQTSRSVYVNKKRLLVSYVCLACNKLITVLFFVYGSERCMFWMIPVSQLSVHHHHHHHHHPPSPSLPPSIPLPKIIVRTLYCMKFAWLDEVRLGWWVQAYRPAFNLMKMGTNHLTGNHFCHFLNITSLYHNHSPQPPNKWF
jgi:hypothetical protein